MLFELASGAVNECRTSCGMSVECEIAARHVTTAVSWSIYWRDRNSKFHRFQDAAPSTHVEPLLDHIADSGDPIFWG